MVKPERRRQADPLLVYQLWGAVANIRHQRQIPNLERISKYMQREHGTKPSETELQLQYAVADNLLDAYTAVGSKGSRVGMEQEGYRNPEQKEAEMDDHDWYCFDCHQPGEVVLCNECWRVYHPTCADEDWTGPKFICAVCKDVKKKPRMKRKEINRLLGYTVLRLKDKTKELHSFKIKGEMEELRTGHLMYKYVDLNSMEVKTKDRKYKYIEQFYSDCRTILHNIFIVYGDTGVMPDLAKIMIKDCKYDLEEIRQCKYCYHYSNAKPKDWFCQPCKPPHELVYAKQKGFSFWPAKVIRASKEGYDVRFFGGWHQRSVIPESSVKSIETPIKDLKAKRTAGFVKACNELSRHQAQLEKMAAEEDGDDDGEIAEEEDDEEHEEEEEELSPIPHKKIRKRSQVSAKDYEDAASVISSSVVNTDKDSKPARRASSLGTAPTPEDANLVTSSEDNIQTTRIFSTMDIGVQTSKKLLHPGKPHHKGSQTDQESGGTSTNCDCEAKYNKLFNDFKEQLENDHEEEKQRSFAELEERLRKDFEEEKQQAITRAVSGMQRDLDRLKRLAEERAKDLHSKDAQYEDIKKNAAKHKAEISATKKKQWCYNCEEEAMYHCCWNTSYCSIKCQQEHWHREHKRMCRRKRT